jgi:Cytochrome P460
MRNRRFVAFAFTAGALTLLVCLTLFAQQDKYSLKVPGGLAFSEFRGYESWQVISVSHNGDKLAVILGNPTMINAYKAGIPENGKQFPDGAKMAKIHWTARRAETYPGPPTVAGALHDVDFMVKNSKKFADTGGWGYAEFEYDAASNSYQPGNSHDRPPQENNAGCGYACHTTVQKRDYVFTEYGQR